jgi:alpha-1,2-mannosyltransferase
MMRSFDNTPRNPPFWLNSRRVRTHGLLLAACLWAVYVVDMSTPGLLDRNGLIKGTDFLHFYTLGKIALLGRGDLLYDMRGQSELIQLIVPEASGYSYVSLYGPQVSLLFAPLAKLSYGYALATWLSLNAAIYAGCCFALGRSCSNLQKQPWTLLILATAFPGFFHLIAWGQTSGLALLCFTGAYFALRSERRLLAGLAIGCLIFKPQLGIAAAIVFLLSGEWRVVAGAIVATSAQFSIGWLHYGTTVMRHYWQALTNVQQVMPLLEPRPYQMHSARAFWSLLLPWPQVAFGLYLLSSVAVLVLCIRCWRSKASLQIRYSSLLLATVLIAPHLTVYDLVILAPAFLLLGDWAIAQTYSIVAWLLYACYALFLLGPVVKVIHLQLSVPAMFVLLWLCYRSADWRFAPQPATLVTS